MTGQPPKPLQNFHFFHWEIVHFFTSLFQFFIFIFLIENDVQNLCIMLATRHRIVMNDTTQVAEGRGKNLYINSGYFIVAFLPPPALLVKSYRLI